jgi:PAS domain S-box-containing protein
METDIFARISPRYSLRWRLPLLISGLIALILTTFLWAAYHEVQATLVSAAGVRAQGAADQVAELLDGERMAGQLQQLAVDPALRRFLLTRSDETREIARGRLQALGSSATRRIELWDDAGTRLLEVANPKAGDGSARALPAGAAPSASGISPLQGSGDTVFADATAEIRADDAAGPTAGPRLGYVRIRTTVAENPQGIFSRLVGHGAVVRIGNRTGDVWTDFARVLPPGNVDLGHRGIAQYRDAAGELRIGAVSLIRATPWAAWVEFPFAAIVAPARSVVHGMILVTLILVTTAALLGTAMAVRITAPLSEITKAAATLAAGGDTRPLTTTRRDEIGQLSRAFNRMAADVKATGNALRDSEASYRRLFASNPHPMWVYDVETLEIIDVNEMATAHYGYTRDEFLAMTIMQIRPEADLPALLDNVRQSAPKPGASGVWRHRKKDGTTIDVEVSSHAFLLGQRQARVVLALDVTDRLRAQGALRESEALFRGMAEAMPHIVWTAAADGRIAYVNRQGLEYLGVGMDEARRSGWQLGLHSDDLTATNESFARALGTGKAFVVTYRLKRASDGAYRWHMGRAAPLRNDDGEIVLWVGTSTDVDDQRRDQEALRLLNEDLEQRVLDRTSALQEANQELEAFSYSVSHDLRAPLRHVQGYVEMLTGVVDGQLTDQGKRYLKIITDATVEMGELIDDLLAFSRIARIQMAQGHVSLESLVRNTIAGLEMTIGKREIVWHIAPLPEVIGDPSMLKQVYVNLIGNAVKYTRNRNPAVIEVGYAGQEDGQHILFVRDNGAGFDMKYVHKLFGVFQRLHRADEFEGTGIGLATTRRIVVRHGGRTWAEGEIDRGATIYFTLPAAAAQEQPAAADLQVAQGAR